MDTAICGIAPTEKSALPPAADPFHLECLENVMELKKEAKTLIYVNQDKQVVVSQPDEICVHCDGVDVAFVYMSPDRARLVAAEMLRLADEIEGK